ncbi:Glycerol-3-phosphate cytidylyltransferase [mine drainage metagenome]|uniref:Glycerol-3-phosphate cytidylyltransferase n=1 Tax=mine drainage metagenome TaxID=410659 RepID=T1A9F2_9ZZZZ|nr:adenylyltransferase/cytidyltransferase family protein [Thermoplasmata archaeon]
MVRVMATGVFDLLHPGHVYFLSEARKLGDELVVVVARDQTARRLKHEPYVPEMIRREMVEALKPVDRAILGSTTDIYQTVVEVHPDLIALGHDQMFNEAEVERECARRGVPAKVVRVGLLPHDDLATRKIVERILERARSSKEANA